MAVTPTFAAHCAEIALGHVERAYPYKPGHALERPGDLVAPAVLHPVFHGSYDWHSCVHSYWMLARLLRLFPDMPPSAAIRNLFARRLGPEHIAGECATFARPGARGFERPYGWAWLLTLAAELARHDEPAWSRAVAPLTAIIVARFRDFLPIATYPIRAGKHPNTAFALRLAIDYADAHDADLAVLIRATATRWYGADVACPAWGEPGGDEFLSPTLIEAECMRRLLPAEAFAPWFARFLPALADGEPAVLFAPAIVSDRSDGQIAHLDGLNLSRAWCWRALAPSLPEGGQARQRAEAAATRHLEAALPHLAGDYMGEHWLATFAVLALDGIS